MYWYIIIYTHEEIMNEAFSFYFMLMVLVKTWTHLSYLHLWGNSHGWVLYFIFIFRLVKKQIALQIISADDIPPT